MSSAAVLFSWMYRRSAPRDLFAFAFEIGDLAGDELSAARCGGEFAKNVAQSNNGASAWPAARISNAIVSRASPASTAIAFAENLVTSRPAAAEVVVVHARQIVVDERVGVDALDRAGGGQRGCRSGRRMLPQRREQSIGRRRLPPAKRL